MDRYKSKNWYEGREFDLNYYKKLFEQSHYEKESILEGLAEKLIDELNIEVIDFKGKEKKEFYINQVRYKKDVLFLKNPLKLIVTKKKEGFEIEQEELKVEVSGKTFKEGLQNIQEKIYQFYQAKDQ